MEPLAERMRPATLDEYIGQEHLVGDGAVLRNAIDNGNLPSIILWGPPGVGKTTLARIIANHLKRPFYNLSAINSGVKDVREVIDRAQKSGLFDAKNPLMFIDEIHRFSKSQQDSLLGAVEKGTVTLIGATTENPSFEVISPLLSRCQVYLLKPLTDEHLQTMLQSVLEKDPLLSSKNIVLQQTSALLQMAGGDARRLLNHFELVVQNTKTKEVIITDELVLTCLQQNPVRYDKDGEQHYDIISAFIKSLRGSDPNAAVYWLARMVEGGEKPEFIARRLLILASEDIGNANPTALVVANSCFQAVHVLGWPEARIVLSQCAIYLATSPKSNASYVAIKQAQETVKKTGNAEVPLWIRNAPTEMMKQFDYGKGYKYSHDFDGNFIQQEYLPDQLKGTLFYIPGNNPREKEIKTRLSNWWKGKYKY
ncbi:MAG: replication-associated recombination protein A [Leptospirales bacterium]